MGAINRLPRSVYEKIAAGEVVERPASVIKELVENSIDAGADKITVEIKKGGSVYMRVIDNGCGMEREDAEVAFLRHATSKLATEEDLDAITTMGFRGEALASIGAVSAAEVFTKRACDELGTHVVCADGEVRCVEDAGCPDGTMFIVQNLFYNVPARMKFLKKDATEAAYASSIMTRFILAHPEISFRFINNDKEQLFSPGDNKLQSGIYSVYGKDYARSAIEFDSEYEGVRVYGAAGGSDTARSNRDYQSCFINKRYVKSPLVSRAIEEAYKNQVMVGKFPMAVVNIDINPAMIDINVHPTKQEVKFSDEALVYRAVYHGVKNALYSTQSIPQIKHDNPSFVGASAAPREYSEKKPIFPQELPRSTELIMREERVSTVKAKKPSEKKNELRYDTDVSIEYFENRQTEISKSREQSMKRGGIADILLETAEAPKKSVPEKRDDRQEQIVYKEPGKKREVRTIGQVFNTYIIAESEGELLLIDQHAAHERLMYEKLKRDLAKREIVSQTMLVPTVVNLNPLEMAAYKEYADKIAEMGFDTEEFGDNAVVVRSAPYDLPSDELEDLILGIILGFSENKNEVITEKQDRLLYTIACKAAIKANHTLSAAEQQELAERVLNFDNINTCPHGRPITVSVPKKELEKMFKRIV